MEKKRTEAAYNHPNMPESKRNSLNRLTTLHGKGVAIRPLLQQAVKAINSSKLGFLAQRSYPKETKQSMKTKNVGGRPRSMDAKKMEEAQRLMGDPQYSVAQICRMLEVSRSTLYRYMKQVSQEDQKNVQKACGTCTTPNMKLPNRIYRITKERVIGMACGDCGKKKVNGNDEVTNLQLPVCDLLVLDCGAFNIPNGFVVPLGATPTVAFVQNLFCSSVIETVTCTTTIPGCGTVDTPVDIAVVSLQGTISYIVNIPVTSLNCPAGTTGFISFTNTVTVDNIVCVTGPGFVCPVGPICDPAVVGAVVLDPAPQDCAGVLVANVTFTLPNICPVTP